MGNKSLPASGREEKHIHVISSNKLVQSESAMPFYLAQHIDILYESSLSNKADLVNAYTELSTWLLPSFSILQSCEYVLSFWGGGGKL